MSDRVKCRRIASSLLFVTVALCLSGWVVAQGAAPPPAGDQPDPYAVPDGPPAKLAEFIQGVLRTRPPNAEARQKAVQAMLEAADKLLAGGPTDAQAQVAVQVKLMFIDEEGALKQLADQLSKANLPKAARQARVGVLKSLVGTAAMQSPKQFQNAIQQVSQHLGGGPVEPADVELVVFVARMAERTDRAELALDLLGSFAKRCAASEDKQIAGLAGRLEPILRRLSLPGNPMKIEGTLLGGEKFDFAKYRGKVVLVDFWASWCGPCVREVPNMKKTYEKYHDQGFEIVGISLDHTRQALEAFIKKEEIPWTILYTEGSRSPTANYYGISAIPTMILIGRDGNVASLNARGPQLPAKLEKLLGQPTTLAKTDPPPGRPQPKEEPKKPEPKDDRPLKATIVIKITPKGVESIGGKPFTGGSFLDVMASKVPENDRPITPIRIEASADVKHTSAVRGIDALKKLGFRHFKFVKR